MAYVTDDMSRCPHCKRDKPPTDYYGPSVIWLCCMKEDLKPGWKLQESGAYAWVGIGNGDVERGT